MIFEKLIPRFVRNDLFLLQVSAAFASPLESWYTLIKSLSDYLDPILSPASWLNALMRLVGFPRDDGLPDSVKRDLIQVAFRIWDKKGTPNSIFLFIRYRFGVGTLITRISSTSFLASVGKAGDSVGFSGGLPWQFEISFPGPLSISHAEFREILKPYVACYETYNIND